jgi:UPF0755 protein
MKAKIIRLLFFLIILSGLGIALLAWDDFARFRSVSSKSVIIEKGTSLRRIAYQLAGSGTIERPLYLELVLRLREHMGSKIIAGEYEIPAGSDYIDIANLLASGNVKQHLITIPEGSTIRQIVEIVNRVDGLSGELNTQDFKEGYYLPQTYAYTYGDSRLSILKRMNAALIALAKELKIADDKLHEVLIIASIIEKETPRDAEKPFVSSVYYNRLDRGMRLQADPTLVYYLNDILGKNTNRLYHSQLKIDTPYNTYKYHGLPPTPIANPSRAAICAALMPLKTNYYYFVADGNGGHIFANDYKAHITNVNNYRKTSYFKDNFKQ